MLNDGGAEGPWAIEVAGLTKYYGHIVALRGVNLRVKRGESVTIFGPNGAGKTTLIKVLASILKPSSGVVRVNGVELKGDLTPFRREIGLVTHKTLLYESLTAYENLKFYGQMYRVPGLEERIEEVIEEVGLMHRRHSQVKTFSRGMQQRLALARAILHRPSILLFDEPYSGLDPGAIRSFGKLLERLLTGERTVVMTTHDLSHGLEVCDSVAIMVGGRITYHKARGELEPMSFEATYFSQVEKGQG